ncbi:hypothetical protein ATPR_0700 [Acetobacter tropicalis NBRC 101654]|uniref:Uncharacterized protein n=1 Tax=Acetobacter tropicalis NBRC 101654 TaxID=749388 RepID=F7VBF6_9PROT|nr:hypothetical protein ATPR_0700 [Acetobacter tropicalis NBRC 101654]
MLNAGMAHSQLRGVMRADVLAEWQKRASAIPGKSGTVQA